MKNIFLYSLVALAFLFGCNTDNQKPIDPEKLTFTVTNESKLYFSNVRKSEYDFDDEQAVGVYIYRPKGRTLEADYPVLNLVIAHNWKSDMAYIFFEPNKVMSPDTTVLENATFVIKAQSGEPQIIEYSSGSVKALAATLASLYNATLNDQPIFWINEAGEEVALFSSNAEKEIFRKTCFDYYKLINAFN